MSPARKLTRLGWPLLASSWVLNWALSGPRTEYLFFPLWLGLILVLNDLGQLRTGSCLLGRAPKTFWTLFLLSVPAWWLFELCNDRLGNWEYVGTAHTGSFGYAFFCSLSFSTVIPAVLSAAELAGSFAWCKRLHAPRPARPKTVPALLLLSLCGAGMLVACLAFPTVAYPLLWVSLFFLCDPLAELRGRPSLLRQMREGDWRAPAALAAGVLVCAFFWEMWNYWSNPRWIYHTPGANFLHVFEMPLLGYLGYIPFSFEVFALVSLCSPTVRGLRIGQLGRGRA